MEGGQNEPSTSKRKLELLREHLGPADQIEDGQTKERCFVEIQVLNTLFTCAECGSVGNFDVCFGDKMGFSRQIKVICPSCPFVTKQFSCSRLGDSDNVKVGFDVNYAIVSCFNELGLGYAAISNFLL